MSVHEPPDRERVASSPEQPEELVRSARRARHARVCCFGVCVLPGPAIRVIAPDVRPNEHLLGRYEGPTACRSPGQGRDCDVCEGRSANGKCPTNQDSVRPSKCCRATKPSSARGHEGAPPTSAIVQPDDAYHHQEVSHGGRVPA